MLFMSDNTVLHLNWKKETFKHKFELSLRCFDVLEASVTIGFSSLSVLLCLNAVAENAFFFLSSCFTYAKKREMFKERPAVVVDAVVL